MEAWQYTALSHKFNQIEEKLIPKSNTSPVISKKDAQQET